MMVFQPTAARSSHVFAISPQKFRSGVDDTELVQRVRVQRHKRAVADTMSAEEFIIHSFDQHRWRFP